MILEGGSVSHSYLPLTYFLFGESEALELAIMLEILFF
jgi:hypothetical protein